MLMKNEIIPNDGIFCYYFYFMQERMNMFWRKYEGEKSALTDDGILKTYKFTNVYRACDRVSQYLINEVIYKDLHRFSPEDVLLRILIFKVFNKIDTWTYLEDAAGEITMRNFDVDRLSRILAERIKYVPIFNNAYMMTGSHKKYNDLTSKHKKWLTMIRKVFIGRGIIDDILRAKSLEEVFLSLESCSFIGGFLAYQYAIDFNYSPYVNFSENSFVKAGIGAIRGIKKCFYQFGDCYEDAIYYTWKNLDALRVKYGFADFKPLPGHAPTLIDIQNCFCETDKYLRVKRPDVCVDNIRIKQKYKATAQQPLHFAFPPKWNVSIGDNPNDKRE